MTVLAPGRPSVTKAEAEGFRCGPAPKLSPGVPSYDGLLGHALVLRNAYDNCADRNARLIDQATRDPSVPVVAKR